MTKEHEVFLKNIKHIAKQIADAQTEEQMKREVAMVWGWLDVRSMVHKDELIDRTLPPLLEAIEEAYEWNVPTLEEFKQKAHLQTPPDEDER